MFETRGEVSPPIRITEKTKGRQILDLLGERLEKVVQVGKKPVVSMRFKPKVIEIPSRRFIVRSLKPFTEKSPIYTSEFIEGRRFATISKSTGKSKRVAIKDFNKLPKEFQSLLKIREKELATGKLRIKRSEEHTSELQSH